MIGRRAVSDVRGLPVPQPEGYLTVREVAELARCEHKSVRRAITEGRLQAFRGPKRYLIRDTDARAWIEAVPVRPAVGRAPRTVQRASRSRASARGSVAHLRDIERKAAQ